MSILLYSGLHPGLYIVLSISTERVTFYLPEKCHPKSPTFPSKGENVDRPEAINPLKTKKNTTFQEQGQKIEKPQNSEKYL